MRYIKILSLIALALIFNACEQDFEDDDFRPRDRTSGWVEFEVDTFKTFPSRGEYRIPFDVQVPINDDGLMIDYTAETLAGTPPEGSTGSFTAEVPKDTRNTSDFLDIGVEPSEEYSIKYTMNSVNADNVTVGIEGSGRPTEHVVNVCPVPLEWTGEVDVTGATFTLTLTPTDDPRIYETETAWAIIPITDQDGNIIEEVSYPATFEINDDQSLDITAPNSDQTGGSGVMNTCDGTMEYTLQQERFLEDPDDPDSDFLEFVVTLTANN